MLEIINVSKYRSGVTLVNNLNLSIPTGELVALLGPNGSGKTSTLKLLAGFWSADQGEILLDQVSVKQKELYYKKITYLPEQAIFFPGLKVKEQLAFIRKLKQVKPERFERIISSLELDSVADQIINNLSTGWIQRLSIASVLMSKADLILLDEPNASLDLNQTAKLFSLLKDLSRDAICIVSLHGFTELTQNFSRILYVQKGQVVDDYKLPEKVDLNEIEQRYFKACVK